MLNLKHRAVGLLAVGFFACILMGTVHSFAAQLFQDVLMLAGIGGNIVFFLEPVLSASVSVLVFVFTMNNFLSKDLSQPSRLKNTFLTYFGIWVGISIISIIYPLIWDTVIGNQLVDAKYEYFQAYENVHYLIQVIFGLICWEGKYVFALLYFLIKLKSFEPTGTNHPPIPQKG